MIPEKRIVKIDIVGNEHTAFQKRLNMCRDLAETGSHGYHIVGNACKALYEIRNGPGGFDQRFIPAGYGCSIVQHNSHFRYVVISRIPPGSFDIDDGVHVE